MPFSNFFRASWARLFAKLIPKRGSPLLSVPSAELRRAWRSLLLTLVQRGERIRAASLRVFDVPRGIRRRSRSCPSTRRRMATISRLLSDTGFGGTSGTLRDPSIFRASDGKYYVAYTRPADGELLAGRKTTSASP